MFDFLAIMTDNDHWIHLCVPLRVPYRLEHLYSLTLRLGVHAPLHFRTFRLGYYLAQGSVGRAEAQARHQTMPRAALRRDLPEDQKVH